MAAGGEIGDLSLQSICNGSIRSRKAEGPMAGNPWILNKDWRTHQELNLKPSDPLSRNHVWPQLDRCGITRSHRRALPFSTLGEGTQMDPRNGKQYQIAVSDLAGAPGRENPPEPSFALGTPEPGKRGPQGRSDGGWGQEYNGVFTNAATRSAGRAGLSAIALAAAEVRAGPPTQSRTSVPHRFRVERAPVAPVPPARPFADSARFTASARGRTRSVSPRTASP